MNYIFPKLLVWVDQTIVPAALISRELFSADFESWKKMVKAENDELRLQIITFLSGTADDSTKKRFLKAQQNQLIMMSDQVNKYMFRDYRQWASSAHSLAIKNHYQMVLSGFEELLAFTAIRFPEYHNSNVKLTDFHLKKVLPDLRHQISRFKSMLNNHSVDPELYDLVIRCLNSLTAPGKISHNVINYIRHLITETTKLRDINQPARILPLSIGNHKPPATADRRAPRRTGICDPPERRSAF
jgi:hypothetical protein